MFCGHWQSEDVSVLRRVLSTHKNSVLETNNKNSHIGYSLYHEEDDHLVTKLRKNYFFSMCFILFLDLLGARES